jgi:transposase-like protein
MAIAYSQDLRQRALNLINSGLAVTQVSRILDISRPTLYKWQHKFQTTGSTAPCSNAPPPHACNITDWLSLQGICRVPQRKNTTRDV